MKLNMKVPHFITPYEYDGQVDLFDLGHALGLCDDWFDLVDESNPPLFVGNAWSIRDAQDMDEAEGDLIDALELKGIFVVH